MGIDLECSRQSKLQYLDSRERVIEFPVEGSIKEDHVLFWTPDGHSVLLLSSSSSSVDYVLCQKRRHVDTRVFLHKRLLTPFDR